MTGKKKSSSKKSGSPTGTKKGSQGKPGKNLLVAPDGWIAGKFVHPDTPEGETIPLVVLPPVDFGFPGMKSWLEWRAHVSTDTSAAEKLAKSFFNRAMRTTDSNKELYGELASVFTARSVRSLPPIGSGWHDVAMLALENVTYAIMVWRFGKIERERTLLKTPAQFMGCSIEVENDRTSKISTPPFVIAHLEGGKIIAMPLWAFNAHRLLPPLRPEWTKECIPVAIQCAQDLVTDVLMDILEKGAASVDRSVPRCVVDTILSAVRGDNGVFLQTGRGGESGGISPGRFLNRTICYVRDQLKSIGKLPPERFPSKLVLSAPKLNRTV